MFYQYLEKNKKLANIKFDTVAKKVKDLWGREYDIVMLNRKYIALIEVKQKAHPKDIEKLTEKQVKYFRKEFKIEEDKKNNNRSCNNNCSARSAQKSQRKRSSCTHKKC